MPIKVGFILPTSRVTAAMYVNSADKSLNIAVLKPIISQRSSVVGSLLETLKDTMESQ